jgi:cyclopropane-fatty-acyl-phospholipid synthase
MVAYWLRSVLSKLVTRGTLIVNTADGRRLTFGDGSGEPVEIRFVDQAAQWRFLLDPDLRLGELYTDGRLEIVAGTLYDFLATLLREQAGQPDPAWLALLDRLRYQLRQSTSFIGRATARRNVEHHYDLDGRLYDLFLDADRQYSCAYFEHSDDGLEEAQLAKKRHIAAKLYLQPGDHVLDLGCGWGGLARYLAGTAGAAKVTGITLSVEQLEFARKRTATEGLAERVAFALTDYRDVKGQFDRIVSVGMFEHVGRRNYRQFFSVCASLLADDGVMLLHTIGQTDGPNIPAPWLTKYIFPGGYLPALSEMLPAVEKSGLVVTDIEILRLHYAQTLRLWRERFMARYDDARRLYDDRFCRMWEFYLASSEAAFRYQNVAVFQIQLARRQETVPLTREYLAHEKERLRACEG